MYKFLSLFILLILSFESLSAQNKQEKESIKKLDRFIAEKFGSVSPGCAVLVAKGNEVIYEKAFGISNIELNVPMKPEMIFRIGSITKQFTAIAVLQLVERGKINLQDSLQKFVPSFPYKGHTITIENLLTHTSGIKDYSVLDAHIPNAIRIEFPAKIVIDSLGNLPLNFTPSSRYEYSNSNYFLLGYIIERLSGKSYKDHLQENVFKPAGLFNTWYDSPTQIIPNRVSGYTKSDLHFYNADYISMSLVYSAGALVSTVGDMFKWHQALHTYRLVKKETLEKAFTAFRLSDNSLSEYGYGWFLKNWKGSKSIGHGGAIDGFRSIEMYFPDQDIFMTALFNSDSGDFLNLFEEMTALMLNKPITRYKDLKLEDSILNRYVGIYRFNADTAEFVKIYRKDNRLYADLSNRTGMNMVLFAQSDTLFYLPDVKRITTTIEFVMEGAKPKGLYWIQDKKYEAKRSDK